jgi:hypothetical protein
LLKIRLFLAIVLLGAIAFPSQARSRRLKPPRPVPSAAQRFTPSATYAQRGLDLAIEKRLILSTGEYTDRLRMAVAQLRSGDTQSASLQSGIKVQVVERLIQLGMGDSAPQRAVDTPSSKNQMAELRPE